MPQHKSAKKRVRQNEKRRIRNVSKRSRLKTALKKVKNAPDKETAEAEYKKTKSLLDKFASKNFIHKNKAANLKSKLSKIIKSK